MSLAKSLKKNLVLLDLSYMMIKDLLFITSASGSFFGGSDPNPVFFRLSESDTANVNLDLKVDNYE